MSHKRFNQLKFTESVPSFLKAAMAQHGVKQTSLSDKRFVSEDPDDADTDARILDAINIDKKTGKKEDRDRKDTEFEKPVVVNVDQIDNLSVKQREQLNDIMRKSQKEDIEDAEKGDDDDEDLFIAKKVMRFAAAPSQEVIGMQSMNRKSNTKRKLKFTKNIKERGKQTVMNNDDETIMTEVRDLGAREGIEGPPTKKRKIYQEMSSKQIKKRRRKKLKFKSNQISQTELDDETDTANKNRSMLSFDPDED